MYVKLEIVLVDVAFLFLYLLELMVWTRNAEISSDVKSVKLKTKLLSDSFVMFFCYFVFWLDCKNALKFIWCDAMSDIVIFRTLAESNVFIENVRN